MQTGHKRRIWPAILLFLLIFCFAMCIRTGAQELISPVQVLRNLWLWLRLTAAELFKLPLALQRQQLIEASPFFLETVARFRILVMTALCGGAIAVGGSVYQIIFRNPMATPSMMGVSSGIELGLLVLVLQYSVDAYAMTQLRYTYAIGFAFLMLLLVIGLGRWAGKNRNSVTDMLLSGSILAQIASAVITFFRFRMEQEELQVYQTLSLYGFTVNTTYEFAGRSLLILLLVVCCCLLPLILMRFSFDALSFSDEETRTMGLRPTAVRLVLLVLVTFMVITAILYCGTIGVLALVIPHISRYLHGSRFRSLMPWSAYLGALLLVLARAISSLIYLEGMGHFPIGTLTGLITAPLLAVVLSQNRRGWK